MNIIKKLFLGKVLKLSVIIATLCMINENCLIARNNPTTKNNSALQKNKQRHSSIFKVNKANNKKVICITIPKCGTHLLIKAISLLGEPGLFCNYTQDPKNLSPDALKKIRLLNKFDPPNHYKGRFHIPSVGPVSKRLSYILPKPSKQRLFWSHWPYTIECEELLNQYTYANFLMIRDPRDQIVSIAFMIKEGQEAGQIACLEDLMLDMIDGRKKHFIRWGVEIQDAYPLLWELGVCDFYKLYIPWANAKNFRIIKFENLVGPQGSGSKETQEIEIKNIAQHLNIHIDSQKIDTVLKELFGKSWTFRSGQIGAWKQYFTPEMKEIFKNTPGAAQLLIDLGYEKDKNW